jgi:protein-arginine kinase
MGTFYPLENMDEETKKCLDKEYFLFDKDNYFQDSNNDWPIGRAIFHSHDKTLLIWVNEEDHLKIISL